MYKFNYQSTQNIRFSPIRSLVLLITTVLLGFFVAQIAVMLFVLLPSSGFDKAILTEMSNNPQAIFNDAVTALATQGVFMLISFVVFPVLLLQYVFKVEFSALWHPKSNFSKQLTHLVLAITLIVLIYPLSLKCKEWVTQAAENNFFGAFGQHLLGLEKEQEVMIESMLNVHDLKGYFILLFVIAILPAFGEELVFRGILQNIFIKMKLPSIAAITLTAFLFSALHFSLTDFLARLFLGFVLGYAYHQTKNFWIPVGLHFLNNAISILYYLALQQQKTAFDIEQKGAIPIVGVVIGSVGFVAFLVIFTKTCSQYYTKNQNT
jgi:uncharacterized protein